MGLRNWRTALFGIVLLAAAFSVAIIAETSDEEFLGPRPIPRILFPINYHVVESRQFELIAVAPAREDGAFEPLTLKIDGATHTWESYAPPYYVAQLDLPPGRHTIALDQVQIAVFVSDKNTEPPNDWPVARRHIAKSGSWQDCTTCHLVTEQKEGEMLGAFKGAAACDACHEQKPCTGLRDHAKKATLRECNLCHAPHGSANTRLLVAPADRLCTKCDDETGKSISH